MTTSVSTRATGTLNPTRRQLDELDALLQRMLELPVHSLDEPEQTEPEEAADEPLLPPAAKLGERPLSGGWSRPHRPADADRSPQQPATRPASPPISYMVVETASPRPLPPASGFEPRPSAPTPRMAPVTPTSETPVPPRPTGETPTLPTPTGEELVPPLVPEPGEDELWVPLRSTWQPSAQTWPPLAESWHQANGGDPASAASGLDADLHPAPTPQVGAANRAAPEVPQAEPELRPYTTDEAPVSRAPVLAPSTAEPRLSLSAEDAPIAVPWPWLPLVWFNQGFDACLAPLGAPGRLLCGHGRQALGVIGLACLAGAVALAASTWMGWTW